MSLQGNLHEDLLIKGFEESKFVVSFIECSFTNVVADTDECSFELG